jgi:hypothetical protein
MTNSGFLRYLVPLLVLISLVIFVSVSALDIRSPGLYYDEALFVNSALGGVTDLFVYKRFAEIPVMIMPYIGALKSWLYYPIFKLFGVDLITIRLPVILLGALSLGLTWRYVQKQFGVLPSVFFILMATLEPSTVFHSRLDWGPTALMMVFRAGLLLALINWYVTGEKRFLLLALVFTALGVFDKLNFVWIATSAFVAGLLVYPKSFFGRTIKVKTVLICLGLSLISLGVLVAVLSVLSIKLTQEVVVSDIDQRFTTFLHLIGLTIKGAGVYSFVVQEGSNVFDAQAYVLTVIAGFAIWGLVVGVRSGKISLRGLVYLALVMFLLGVQVFFTKKAIGPHHFAVFAPIWLIFIAVGLAGAFYAIQERSRVLARVLMVLSMTSIMATSLRCNLAYLDEFKKTQINSHWDQANSTALTLALESQKGITEVVAVDWGIATNVQALSNNRLRVMDFWSLFNAGLNQDQLSWIRTDFVNKGAAFVVYVEGRETFPLARIHFLDAIREGDWPVRQIMSINSADGQPYIEVYLPTLNSK